MGTANSDGLLLPAVSAALYKILYSASAPLAHSFFPFHALFPAALAHSMDPTAHQQSSASRFHRKPCKIRNIVQNYNENADAVPTAHRNTLIPQKLSMEPVKIKTNTLGYATLIISPFHFIFVLYK